VAVAILVAVFIAIEERSHDPLVRISIFRSRGADRANIGAVALFGTYVSFQFLVTQYLQTLAHWSAISTALAFLPAASSLPCCHCEWGPGQPIRLRPTRDRRIRVPGRRVRVFLRAGTKPDYLGVMCRRCC